MASKNRQQPSDDTGYTPIVATNGNGNGNGHGELHTNGKNGHSKNDNKATKKTGGSRFAPRNWGGSTSPARYAHIVGWGMKVPDHVLTNFDLEAVVDTTDEWIRKGTGIQERRIADERETVVTLGFEAARAALDRADILPIDLELVIVATSTPEDIYPSTASKIQNLLGATRAGAFDLSAACSGFVYALNMAAQSIRSGSIDTAIVIGTEVNSRVMDWSDRTTCILFGDGAGAVVLQASEEPGGLLACVLGSDGSGADLLGIPTVGRSVMPEGKFLHKLHMNGREVFRFATHIVAESIKEVAGKADLGVEDISLIVPHQANQRILNAAAKALGVEESMFYSNVARYGNTSAASIPIALCEAERDKRIKPNDNIVLVGFGGGLTWAAAAIKWNVVADVQPKSISFRISQGRREVFYIFAFWRDRVLRSYRRVEAILRGSVTQTPDKSRKGRKIQRDKTPTSEREESEREKMR
jgi:3-oxoacyl-[acyl-carrier-protein] synthase III